MERLQAEHAAAEEERARREEQLMLTHERKVLEMERLERHLEVRSNIHSHIFVFAFCILKPMIRLLLRSPLCTGWLRLCYVD